MKKIIITAAFVMAACVSGMANAAPTSFGETYSSAVLYPKGATVPTADITMECALLAENITVSASSNVRAAVNCAEINNVAEVAACHKGGMRDYISCATYDASSNPITGCSDTTGSGTTLAFSAFFATSAGGVMQTKELKSGNCTEANIKSDLTWTTD